MLTTRPMTPMPARPPTRHRRDTNPWLLWRADAPREREVLSIAELAECACPDLCDRDHANE